MVSIRSIAQVFSVPGVWIHLDVECPGSVWDWLPGHFKSCDRPHSDRDMSTVSSS